MLWPSAIHGKLSTWSWGSLLYVFWGLFDIVLFKTSLRLQIGLVVVKWMQLVDPLRRVLLIGVVVDLSLSRYLIVLVIEFEQGWTPFFNIVHIDFFLITIVLCIFLAAPNIPVLRRLLWHCDALRHRHERVL